MTGHFICPDDSLSSVNSGSRLRGGFALREATSEPELLNREGNWSYPRFEKARRLHFTNQDLFVRTPEIAFGAIVRWGKVIICKVRIISLAEVFCFPADLLFGKRGSTWGF